MKKFIAFATLIALLFSACKKDSLLGENSGRGVTRKAGAGVQPSKRLYQIDLTDPRWREFNSCTGELIKITEGIWHIEFTYVYVNGREVYQFHTNTSNYKLYSPTTGVEYTGSYVSNTTDAIVLDGDFSGAYTQTLTVLLTTAGGGNNSFLKADMHFTVSASGIGTVYFDNFRAGCQ
ncbi:hypothetical protein BH10BAC3_BH10BAC3_04480 [soil metagenome]